MKIQILKNKKQLGAAAAQLGSDLIRRAIATKGRANIIVATGASQFEMLEALIAAPKIDWSRVTAFHLDEYVGMPITHPAMALLGRSNLSVKEIAERCGFDNPLYFTRIFTRLYQAPPTAIRTRLRRGQAPPRNPLPPEITPRVHW